MEPRGQTPPFVFAIAGLLVVIVGAFVFVGWGDKVIFVGESGQPPSGTPTTTDEEVPPATPGKPATPTSPSTPTTSIPPAPQPGTPSTPGTPPSETGAETSAPPSTPPTPAPPAAWSAGFKADSRVTPEIPSENERATLPVCDSKIFTFEPVNLNDVASIEAKGDSATFTMKGTGELYLYDLVASADVYVTNIVQEFDVTVDDEDDTIYFALCKDVFGYITNVKELSEQIYKMVTDTLCLGKPQTGPNACKIEVLNLIGKGSPLGHIGRYGGTFRLGVFDLRKERTLPPGEYPIRTHYAVCPFHYFAASTGFYAKLEAGSDLCASPGL